MLLLLLFLIYELSSANVITLKSNKNITCNLTGDSVYSALYLSSTNDSYPQPPIFVNRSLTVLNNWIFDDWNHGTTNEFSFYPVTDIRWEGFKNKSDGNIDLNSDTTTSFSVCFSNTLFIDTETSVNYVFSHGDGYQSDICQWEHFLADSKKIFSVSSEGKKIASEAAFGDPRVLKIPKKNIYKENDYGFRYSTKKSQNNSILHLINTTTNDLLCISFFVSIDKGGELHVVLQTRSANETKVIKGFNDGTKSWKRATIKTKNSWTGKENLTFLRKGLSPGFWAIDKIHLCRPENETFTTDISSGSLYQCNTLDKKTNNSKVNNFQHDTTLKTHFTTVQTKTASDFKPPNNSTTTTTPPSSGTTTTVNTTTTTTASFKSDYSKKIVIVVTICFLGLLVFGFFKYKKYFFWKHVVFCRETSPIPLFESVALLDSTQSTYFKIEHLEDCIRYLHKERHRKWLGNLFSANLSTTDTCIAASKFENMTKNKDEEHIPYDSTRVVLEDLEGVSYGDYINASYIDGYQHPQTYIACQGPKFNTVLDFWRMIWTKNVNTIVMATDFVEDNGSRNSADYWSQGLNIVAEFGALTVKMIVEEIYQFCVFRIFEVSYAGCVRKLNHLQAKWKQDRCPHPEEVLAVLQKLWTIESHPPIVVHSGFGTNRTGMVILCDVIVKMAKTELAVDFVNLLKNLRNQRPLIIHRFEYFLLAHLLVLEWWLDLQNPYKKHVDKILTSNCVDETDFLERLSLHDRVLLPQKNTSKIEILVKDYHGNQKFIFQPQPKQKEMFKFWEKNFKSDHQFILSINSSKDQLGALNINNLGYTINVNIESTKEISQSCFATKLLVKRYKTIRSHIVKKKTFWLLELTDWDEKKIIPETNINVLFLLQFLREVIMGNDKLLLVLYTNINASAIITIIFNVLEKNDNEKEIDVYRFLRAMKRNYHRFKIQPVELKFIYSAIVDYLTNFDLKTHNYEDVV